MKLVVASLVFALGLIVASQVAAHEDTICPVPITYNWEAAPANAKWKARVTLNCVKPKPWWGLRKDNTFADLYMPDEFTLPYSISHLWMIPAGYECKAITAYVINRTVESFKVADDCSVTRTE